MRSCPSRRWSRVEHRKLRAIRPLVLMRKGMSLVRIWHVLSTWCFVFVNCAPTGANERRLLSHDSAFADDFIVKEQSSALPRCSEIGMQSHLSIQ
jgi:hypothetical protein